MTIAVEIKDLGKHVCTYVAMAEGGERIIVTDRGREVAELRPLSDERQAVRALIEAGVARWSGRKATLSDPLPIDVDMAGAILEDRR